MQFFKVTICTRGWGRRSLAQGPSSPVPAQGSHWPPVQSCSSSTAPRGWGGLRSAFDAAHAHRSWIFVKKRCCLLKKIWKMNGRPVCFSFTTCFQYQTSKCSKHLWRPASPECASSVLIANPFLWNLSFHGKKSYEAELQQEQLNPAETVFGA